MAHHHHYRVLLALAAVTLALFGAAPLAAQSGRILRGDPALYYEMVGARGPLIVVLHGGPGIPHDYLRPEWDRLADGARVVYYDQRGCGRSGRVPPYGWRSHVQDLDRLLRALSPSKPVVLAGSSWGTVLATYYTALHPARVRALVLSGVPPIIAAGGEALDPKWLASVPVARWDSVNRGLPVAPIASRPALDSRLARRVRGECEDIGGIINMSQTDAPRLEDLARVTVPTLVLRGDLSIDAGERLARRLPHARLVTIPYAGHDPWLDQPADFFEAVRRFLARVAAP